MSHSDYAVELSNISFLRSGRTIYSDLSMCFPQGKITAILGPSGCGPDMLRGPFCRRGSGGRSGSLSQ